MEEDKVCKINSMKSAEHREKDNNANVIMDFFRVFVQTSSRKEYLDAVVKLIQELSGCSSVGIRMLDERGNIPYESYVGFSKEFWESENWLSVKKHQCVCIRVITGQIEPPDTSLITAGGSIQCDNMTKFLEGLSNEERSKYRGVCPAMGYPSVAVIPIHYRGSVIGIIHIAEKKEKNVLKKL